LPIGERAGEHGNRDNHHREGDSHGAHLKLDRTEISFTLPSEGRAAGLQVASTFRLPRLLHWRRLTKAAIGVPGTIASRDDAPPVKNPDIINNSEHSTVTVGSARNARSYVQER
jgi:ABC-type enterobactin transport system permease subunit